MKITKKETVYDQKFGELIPRIADVFDEKASKLVTLIKKNFKRGTDSFITDYMCNDAVDYLKITLHEPLTFEIKYGMSCWSEMVKGYNVAVALTNGQFRNIHLVFEPFPYPNNGTMHYDWHKLVYKRSFFPKNTHKISGEYCRTFGIEEELENFDEYNDIALERISGRDVKISLINSKGKKDVWEGDLYRDQKYINSLFLSGKLDER